MPENGVEIVGGLAQSRDPEIYKLPPVADWAVQAAPGENGGESPILYSVALADLSVRQALIAVGDALVPASNGNTGGEVAKTLDLSRLSREQIEEALEGAEKVRDEKDLPAEVRQPVLDFVKATKNGSNGSPETPRETTPVRETKAQRRTKEREEQERLRQEQIAEHQEAKERELETYKAWRKERPYSGKPKINPYDSLDTTVNTKGDIVIFEKDDYVSKLTAYLRELAAEPSILFDELNEGVAEQLFLRDNDLPITLALTQYSAERGLKAWNQLTYLDSEEMLDAAAKWLEVFADFPEEYKTDVRFSGMSLNNLEAKKEEGDLRVHAHVHDFGLKIIYKSLVKVADEQPEQFLDMAYEILRQAVDTGDETARKTILLALSGAVSQSYLARMSIMDAALAPGLDRTAKLKAMDINLLMENEKCAVAETTKKPRRIIPKKFAKQHEARVTAAEYGIDTRKKGWLARLGQVVTPPIVQAIKAGELPDSLYLKVKEQKEAADLPEDA